jgi:hypothetical protein
MERSGDEIKAAPILARASFVNVRRHCAQLSLLNCFYPTGVLRSLNLTMPP